MMTQKFLYLVDHFVGFPQSEYGGVWSVIAEDDNEWFDLITEVDNGSYEECYVNLRNNVCKAPRFALADAVESEVVDRFIT
jgi:hypothetical protein